jgi:hypothetical protein
MSLRDIADQGRGRVDGRRLMRLQFLSARAHQFLEIGID